MKVNCAVLPQELLESELLGYEHGAFSGALRDKPGKFELAHRGTILLDEQDIPADDLTVKLGIRLTVNLAHFSRPNL